MIETKKAIERKAKNKQIDRQVHELDDKLQAIRRQIAALEAQRLELEHEISELQKGW